MEVGNLYCSPFHFDISTTMWEDNAYGSDFLSSVLQPLEPTMTNADIMKCDKSNRDDLEPPVSSGLFNLLDHSHTLQLDEAASLFTTLTPMETSSEKVQEPGVTQETSTQWDSWPQYFEETPTASYLEKIEEAEKLYDQQLNAKQNPVQHGGYNEFNPSAFYQLQNAGHQQHVTSYPPHQPWTTHQDTSPYGNSLNQNFHQEYNQDVQQFGNACNGYNEQYAQNYYQNHDQFGQHQQGSNYNVETTAPTKPAKPLNSNYEQSPAVLRNVTALGAPKRLYSVSREDTGRSHSAGVVGHTGNIKILSGKRSSSSTSGHGRLFYSSGLHRNVANAAHALGQARGLSVPSKMGHYKRDAARVVNQIAPIQIRYKKPVGQGPQGSQAAEGLAIAATSAARRTSFPDNKSRFVVMPSKYSAQHVSNVPRNVINTSPKFAPTAFELIDGSPLRKKSAPVWEPKVAVAATAAAPPLQPPHIKVELILATTAATEEQDPPLVIHAKEPPHVPIKNLVFGHKKLKHRCSRCGGREATIRSLLTHIQSHRKPHCRQCCWIGDTLLQLTSHLAKAHSQLETNTHQLTSLVTSKYGRKRAVYSSIGLGPKQRKHQLKDEKEGESKKKENLKEGESKKKKKSMKHVPVVVKSEPVASKKNTPRKVRSYNLRH